MKKRENKIYEDYFICRTYDKVRSGEYKNFSPHFFGNHDKFKKITIITRYYIEDILKITPKEALDVVTYKKLEQDKLKCMLKYIKHEKPLEYENDKNYVAHLIYFTYPQLEKPKMKDLVLQCYKEVLEGKRKNFPKNYFRSINGEERAKICFTYLWKDILKIEFEDIPKVFLTSNEQGLNILKEYKLKVLTQMIYYSVSDMIQNMYPEINLNDVCYKTE